MRYHVFLLTVFTFYMLQSELHLLALLNSLNFLPAVTKPTRFPYNNDGMHIPSTLDHIFINKIIDFNSAIFEYDLSDHCGTTINCYLYDTQSTSSRDRHKITFRPFSENNLARLAEKLLAVDWDRILQSDDADEQFEAYFDCVNKAYQQCFPKKTKYNSNKRFKNPWLTAETFEKIKQKSCYYRLYKTGS